MVVLDQIHATARQRRRDLRQLRGSRSLRFEGAAGQRPPDHADSRPQAFDTEPGTAELRHCRCGRLEIQQTHIRLQRGVAEQHVEKLSGIVAGRCKRQADPHQKEGAIGFDFADLANHLLPHTAAANRLRRHLDALFDGNGLSTRLDLSRGALESIGNL